MVGAQTYTVTSLEDENNFVGGSAAGTLRWAITQANLNPNSTIDLSSLPANSVIKLTASLPYIEKSMNFLGIPKPLTGSSLRASASGLTIDGSSLYSGFFISSGDVTYTNINIQSTSVTGGAGTNGGGGGGIGIGW